MTLQEMEAVAGETGKELDVDKTWRRPWPTLSRTGGQLIIFKTRLIIAVNLCKQRVLSMCHICDSQSILLAAFRAKFLNRLVVDRNQGNLCGTIIRKSYCYKTALGNFRALRSVHSVQTRSKFLSLAQTLACL